MLKFYTPCFTIFFSKQSLNNASPAFYLYKKSSWLICTDANDEKISIAQLLATGPSQEKRGASAGRQKPLICNTNRVACPCESIWLTVHSRVTVCCETKRFSKAEVRIPVLDNRSQLKSCSMCKISPQQILVHSNDVKWYHLVPILNNTRFSTDSYFFHFLFGWGALNKRFSVLPFESNRNKNCIPNLI